MRTSTAAAAWKFALVATVCMLAGVLMVAVFGQLRFSQNLSYKAEFSTVSGLQSGNFVRVAGVEVGKVRSIHIRDDLTAVVEFDTTDTVVLTEGTKAVIRWQDLTGERYLALQEGAGSATVLPPGGTIPPSRTAPALDIDALIGGLKPLFRALDPDQINGLTEQLIRAFQGEGPTIDALLSQTAAFTNSLADRDELVGQVITNLDSVMSSVSAQSKQVDTAVASLSQLIDRLAAQKDDVADSLAHVNGAAATVADLLVKARPALRDTVIQTDRTMEIVADDHEYFTELLDDLLPNYQAMARNGMNGDFFNAYICDILLKVNGKGGQPIYIKILSQSTGRCTPK